MIPPYGLLLGGFTIQDLTPSFYEGLTTQASGVAGGD